MKITVRKQLVLRHRNQLQSDNKKCSHFWSKKCIRWSYFGKLVFSSHFKIRVIEFRDTEPSAFFLNFLLRRDKQNIWKMCSQTVEVCEQILKKPNIIHNPWIIKTKVEKSRIVIQRDQKLKNIDIFTMLAFDSQLSSWRKNKNKWMKISEQTKYSKKRKLLK